MDASGRPTRRSVLAGTRIDCGIADPFHIAAKKFVSSLHPHPVADLGDGDHTGGYWRTKTAKTIEFIGKCLTSA
jgi:hypothetical protein